MGWIFKQQPPPPPPPKSKVPGWVQLAVPIVFSVIMGLAALSFNGYKTYADMRMDENKASIVEVRKDTEKELDKKVDNQTMQLMIKLQEQQTKQVEEKMERLDKSVEEIKKLLLEQSKTK